MTGWFDRAIFGRLLLAVLIVLPPLFFFQRAQADDERSARNAQLAHAHAQLASERIDRTISECNAYNAERQMQIATSEALIRVAAESPPDFLSDRDRLLIAAFVQRANRQVQDATRKRVCTVPALHLLALQALVDADKGR